MSQLVRGLCSSTQMEISVGHRPPPPPPPLSQTRTSFGTFPSNLLKPPSPPPIRVLPVLPLPCCRPCNRGSRSTIARAFDTASSETSCESDNGSPETSCQKLKAETFCYKLQSRCHLMLPSEEVKLGRRLVLNGGAVSLVQCLLLSLKPPSSSAKDETEDEKDESVLGAIKSLFDPNEKTKSGKVLPKSYLKSAREVVKTLRESLKEDPKDNAKFRRNADAAKESIREYLSECKGQNTLVNEESYVMLEKAIRSLANFYSKAGPSAALPEEIKSEILGDLDTAEEFL